MKLPRLYASLFTGEGTVHFPEDFKKLDPLLRADLTMDWIAELQEAHEYATNDYHESLRYQRKKG